MYEPEIDHIFPLDWCNFFSHFFSFFSLPQTKQIKWPKLRKMKDKFSSNKSAMMRCEKWHFDWDEGMVSLLHKKQPRIQLTKHISSNRQRELRHKYGTSPGGESDKSDGSVLSNRSSVSRGRRGNSRQERKYQSRSRSRSRSHEYRKRAKYSSYRRNSRDSSRRSRNRSSSRDYRRKNSRSNSNERRRNNDRPKKVERKLVDYWWITHFNTHLFFLNCSIQHCTRISNHCFPMKSILNKYSLQINIICLFQWIILWKLNVSSMTQTLVIGL